MQNCLFHNNNSTLDAPTSFLPVAGVSIGENAISALGPLSSLTSAADMLIRNVTARGWNASSSAHAAAFKVRGNLLITFDGITVSDSLVGFRVRGPYPSLLVQNSVFYNVDRAFRFEDGLLAPRLYHISLGAGVTSQLDLAPSSSGAWNIDTRNLLVYNQAINVQLNAINSLTVTASDIQSAPLHDYRLTPSSAARDSQSSRLVETDRCGVLRDAFPDIGAYEYGSPAFCRASETPAYGPTPFPTSQPISTPSSSSPSVALSSPITLETAMSITTSLLAPSAPTVLGQPSLIPLYSSSLVMSPNSVSVNFNDTMAIPSVSLPHEEITWSGLASTDSDTSFIGVVIGASFTLLVIFLVAALVFVRRRRNWPRCVRSRSDAGAHVRSRHEKSSSAKLAVGVNAVGTDTRQRTGSRSRSLSRSLAHKAEQSQARIYGVSLPPTGQRSSTDHAYDSFPLPHPANHPDSQLRPYPAAFVPIQPALPPMVDEAIAKHPYQALIWPSNSATSTTLSPAMSKPYDHIVWSNEDK